MKSAKTILAVVIAGMVVLLCAASVKADIINVPADQPTIQAGIDAAVDGDEVVVAPGTYNETINLLGKAVTLRSSDGPEVTIIDAKRLGVVVTCASGEGPDTLLAGFTITGGISAGFGGGVRIGGGASPTIEDCVIRENFATFGGGLSGGGGSATVIDCTFRSNTARFGGGMCCGGDGTLVARCVFHENVAIETGGGMDFNTEVTVVDTIFVGNMGVGSGGAIRIDNFGISTMSGCIFSGNLSGSGAGGLFNEGSLTLTSCLFINNRANGFGGGGLLNTFGSSASVAGCTFIGNTAIGVGGAIKNESTSSTSLTASLFCGNTPDDISGPYEDGGGNQFPKECLMITGGCCVKGVCAVLTPILCTSLKGVYQGDDTECDDATCSQECPADLDDNGVVGPLDLAQLLAAWGVCLE